MRRFCVFTKIKTVCCEIGTYKTYISYSQDCEYGIPKTKGFNICKYTNITREKIFKSYYEYRSKLDQLNNDQFNYN